MVKVNPDHSYRAPLAWKVTYLLRSWGRGGRREYHLPYHVLQQMSNTHPKHRIIYQFQPCILGAFSWKLVSTGLYVLCSSISCSFVVN